MGGTFDPIHHGHLVAASEVAGLFGLDEVVFVPTGQPWQKSDRGVSPAEDRYLMTVIATASNPRFSVSRVDVDRGGPTYTIDTLSDLHRLHPDAELFFITGADALAQIVGWRETDKLFQLAHFVGVTRPGYQLADADLPRGAVSLVEVPALAISSTDCRDRVRRGRPVWYLVPDGVVQYIEKRGLYHPGTAGADELLADTAPRVSGFPAERLLALDHRESATMDHREPAAIDHRETAATPPDLSDTPTHGDDPSPDLQEIPR
ncbi:nicotinate-nucleotide adenylyltransferase [Modestobacter caceresii]|jgi:nicotinate-nucleotide adenylyltransferase|uniref:Probable nicotinate-nucleotide adenylyltransferase n=2 Tax=Geodermatophilaceae TaxID=85030 RepID=A0A098Y4X3_9ACTN|nr:nicotinate-nucleotide adenylyltransferase [Modestobacter caceresii]